MDLTANPGSLFDTASKLRSNPALQWRVPIWLAHKSSGRILRRQGRSAHPSQLEFTLPPFLHQRRTGACEFADFKFVVIAKGESDSNYCIFIQTDYELQENKGHLYNGYEINLNTNPTVTSQDRQLVRLGRSQGATPRPHSMVRNPCTCRGQTHSSLARRGDARGLS